MVVANLAGKRQDVVKSKKELLFSHPNPQKEGSAGWAGDQLKKKNPLPHSKKEGPQANTQHPASQRAQGN